MKLKILKLPFSLLPHILQPALHTGYLPGYWPFATHGDSQGLHPFTKHQALRKICSSSWLSRISPAILFLYSFQLEDQNKYRIKNAVASPISSRDRGTSDEIGREWEYCVLHPIYITALLPLSFQNCHVWLVFFIFTFRNISDFFFFNFARNIIIRRKPTIHHHHNLQQSALTQGSLLSGNKQIADKDCKRLGFVWKTSWGGGWICTKFD